PTQAPGPGAPLSRVGLPNRPGTVSARFPRDGRERALDHPLRHRGDAADHSRGSASVLSLETRVTSRRISPMTSAEPRTGAFVFVFIAVLVDSIGFGIILPVLPRLIMALTHVDVARAAEYGGWLAFVYALMQFFCAPVLGNLSDRFGRRPVLL